MVSFVCGVCSEVLKKKQVQKHSFRCNSDCYSCLDCNVNFTKAGHVNHIKCITEQQKYHGSTYQSKVNKGEVKQAEWSTMVNKALETTHDLRVRKLLNQVGAHDNTPRKLEKFVNFVKNCVHCYDRRVAEAAFNAIKAVEEEEKAKNGTQNGTSSNGINENPVPSNGTEINCVTNDENPPKPRLSLKNYVETIKNYIRKNSQTGCNYYDLCASLVTIYRDTTCNATFSDEEVVHAICDEIERIDTLEFVASSDIIRFKNL